MSPRACDACLGKSALIGYLGARLSAVLGGLDRRLGNVLSLAEDDLIAAVAGRHAEAAHRYREGFDPRRARRSLAEAGVDATCPHRGYFPPGMLALVDVPPVIYITGGEDRLREVAEAPVATIVGTRTPSRYATEVAQELGRGLATAGVTVVSGLALGVDAAAHRGALSGGGRPVGVLAGGVDVPYPRANRTLHEQVLGAGVLVSELPPGHRPLRWSFPARNRIMAALGQMTIVVEAAECSGTLITAEFAAQLGRDIGAVPGQVTARLAAGSNRLLREGAAVICSPQDALDELLGVGSARRLARGDLESDAPGGTANAERPSSRARAPAPRLTLQPSLDEHALAEHELDASLRRVLDLVEGGETVEAIARETGLGPSRARAALGRLEVMGLVARDGFAGYARTLAAASRAAPILGGSLASGQNP